MYWFFISFSLQDVTPENKLRLLMIYASVYPEKFEGDKASKLMQVAMEFLPFLFIYYYCHYFIVAFKMPLIYQCTLF